MDVLDISGLIPREFAELEILRPGGLEKIGWTIRFCSTAHPKAIKWSTEAATRDLRVAHQMSAAQANGKRYVPEQMTVEEQRRRNVGWVVSRIVGWTPDAIRLGPESPPVTFSDEAAIDLFCDPRMSWAYQQILDFLLDEKSFSPASATNSPPSQRPDSV